MRVVYRFALIVRLGVDGNAVYAYVRAMQTEIYESDPFSGSRGTLIARMESDYRIEKGDELTVSSGGRRLKLRITFVRLELEDGTLRRELLGLKI